MSKRVKYPTITDHGEFKLPRPEKPFASINLELDDSNGKIKVNGQILVDRLVDERGVDIEGAKFGIALDGSASMTQLYGTSVGPYGYGTPNEVEPVAKAMISFLSDFAESGKVELAYWSVGSGGDKFEIKGEYSKSSLANMKIRKPSKPLGRRTLLLPILEHFADDYFKDTPWSMGVIITDGEIDDIEEVADFTEKLAKDIHDKKRGFLKLVLIGVGDHVSFDQIQYLDDFTTEVGLDIWDSAYAREWSFIGSGVEDDEDFRYEVLEVFKEVMSDNLYIARSGKILDDGHNEVFSRSDGFPAKVEFELSKKSKGFVLKIEDYPQKPFDLSKGIDILLGQ